MVSYTFNETEIKTAWKHAKNKRYSIQSFIKHGSYVKYIIFDDIQGARKCTGKIVTKFLEGEVYHWPRLQHDSLAPLLDIIYIDERLGIYMTTHLTHSLRDTIHNDDFVNDPLNFDRKKSYIADILWGVDYIHSKNLSLMNMSDASVFVCPESDKAVIADFTCLVLFQNAAKHRKCAPYMYRAPELSAVTPFAKKKEFDPIFTNIWSVGVMIMEIFLSHSTPWGLVDYEPSRAPDILAQINCDMLKVANKGSAINNQDADDLKRFLALFLDINPKNRSPANKSVLKNFIQIGKYRVMTKIDNFPVQFKKKLRKVGDSDKMEFSSNKSTESPLTETNKKIHQLKHVPVIGIRSHKYLKELPDVNSTRSKPKNSAESSDHSNAMKSERVYCKTDSLHVANFKNEEPNITCGSCNIITPKRQIARLNEIQEAATNLSIKLCRYYKELEEESNANKKDFVNNSNLKEDASLCQIDNFREDLRIQESNSITDVNNNPNNKYQENGDSSSDITTESKDSNQDSECIFKRFSEPKMKFSDSKRNFKLFRASAPALQNLAFPLKKDDSQQSKDISLKASTQWEDGQTSNSIQTVNPVVEIFHKQDAKSAYASQEETLKSNKPDNKLMLHPSEARKLKNLNKCDSQQIKDHSTQTFTQWEDGHSPSSKKADNSGSITENFLKRSVQLVGASGEKIFKESMHVNKLAFNPSNADKFKTSNITRKNQQYNKETTANIDDKVQDCLVMDRSLNEESFGLDHSFNSNTPNMPLHFNPFISKFHSAQERQIIVAKRRLGRKENESDSKRMNKVNESLLNKPVNEIKTQNYIAEKKCQNEMDFTEAVNVTGTKSGNKNETRSVKSGIASKKKHLTTSLKCKNENQYKKTANTNLKNHFSTKPTSENGTNRILNAKDSLSTKQKCQVSKALLKEGNQAAGRIHDSSDHKSTSMVPLPTGLLQQQTNTDVEAKKKKEKKTTCFCFSKK